MHHDRSNQSSQRGTGRRHVRVAIKLVATGVLALAVATPALAATGNSRRNDRRHQSPAVEFWRPTARVGAATPDHRRHHLRARLIDGRSYH
jgi:hypothetical protein